MEGFQEFEPIFNEPRIGWAKNSNPGSGLMDQFLMHIFAPDDNHLKIQVTDYHSNTFEAVKSVMQLDDMRDCIGIGGSWTEFVEYLVASFKAEDAYHFLHVVKRCVFFLPLLWFACSLGISEGVAYAKLVAQKSKGMPLISISLTKLLDNAARDAMANMSFGLFKAFKCTKNLVVQEKEHSLQLKKVISAEKERSENTQSQLGKRQKLEKMNSSDRLDVSGPPASNGAQNSPDKLAGRDPASTKVTNRVVPAFRRAKVRGALLQDIEDDKDN
ncbi:hypothetical protein NC653_013106 [Populus alba x Populus x berolinensis]|uniref:Uncharacterized protein n=1 Tax=Populus alba x Populus x berolinensis TaxID=444605 RepID=A0AAD6QUJ4_9ROSI|nr:hypothetical protein NC653_013106 [Populus alba x Populus x berolinensis]